MLAILGKLLLHLPLELLRLALQHLLLPLLLDGLRAIALLLGDAFLTLRQLIELFQRVVDLLRALFGSSRGGLPGLILVFLGIELEIEESGQIARGAASSSTASAASTPSKRNLDLPEGGFGAKQVLQRLLLMGDGVLPLLLLQRLRGGTHRLGGGDHVLFEIADCLHLIGQLTGLQAAGKRHGLIAQGGLGLVQQLGDLGGLLLGGILVRLLLERGGDDFLLSPRDLGGIVTSPAPAAATRLLRLRKLALERVGLDEHHIRVGFGIGILGGGVDADQIAGNELELLQ